MTRLYCPKCKFLYNYHDFQHKCPKCKFDYDEVIQQRVRDFMAPTTRRNDNKTKRK